MRPRTPPALSGRARFRTRSPRLAPAPKAPPAGNRKVPRTPHATYRLQFGRQFTFAQAMEVSEYLAELGISDCYASPLFQASPESTHGYDICRFDQFSPNLGGTAAFQRFTAHLRQLGLGLLLDMVPNHMGADLSNAWWLDVLEKGPASAYASWFDIEWRPCLSRLPGKVLLPVLEDHYAKVLEAGKLKLVFEEGGFAVAYYDRKFPLRPASYAGILGEVSGFGSSSSKARQLAANLAALVERLSAGRDLKRPAIHAELAKIKDQLRLWAGESGAFKEEVGQVLHRLNGIPGKPRSFDVLDRILRQQHYRLAYWRAGSEEINYRRFFDVAELVSVRMELPEVFQASHALLFDLVRKGQVTGLRVDHPDGLWNPKQYFERLQTTAGTPLYVVAEKILTGDELLPADWQVAGTTGYDFLNHLNGIFVNQDNGEAFDAFYRRWTGSDSDLESIIYASKIKILERTLLSELNSLTDKLKQLASRTRYGLDFTFGQLKSVLQQVIAAFPVYRTYITSDTAEISPADRECIISALDRAQVCNPGPDPAAFDFVKKLLQLQIPEDLDDSGRQECRLWVLKFQQLTGPVMAKGLEDTTFYNYNRLVSLNEVGGHPAKFGNTLDLFHRHNLTKADHWPHSLLATATHDTKRGEDTRARINVLSELPEEWALAVARWSNINSGKKSQLDGQPAPDRNDEYLLYQTLVGAWVPEAENPAGLKTLRSRLASYMLKAIKEAKRHTAWTEPNAAYEKATKSFVEALLSGPANDPFLVDFVRFQKRVAFFGQFNSLSQTLLKLTSPGVPDFYQGTELWDFSLVDPDNRRRVDFEARQSRLQELEARSSEDLICLCDELLRTHRDGRIKLWTTLRALRFRRDHPALFQAGSYIPLSGAGEKQEHLIAFARTTDREMAIVAVPRLAYTLSRGASPSNGAVWGKAELVLPPAAAGAPLVNIFTGEELRANANRTILCADLFGHFPVALLSPM